MVRVEFVLEVNDEETFVIRPNRDRTIGPFHIKRSGLGAIWRRGDLKNGIISLKEMTERMRTT